MRHPMLLLLVAACAGSTGEGPTSEGSPVEVQGIVFDSVTSAPVSGATVSLRGTVTLTDTNGAFVMQVSPGIDTATVVATSYEPYAHFVPVTWTSGAGSPVHFRLRRVGPFPVRCTVGPQGFTATIVDLQGRLTAAEWASRTVILFDPAPPAVTTGSGWQYEALDSLQAGVGYADGSTRITNSYWVLTDGRAKQFRGYCPVTKAGSVP